MNIPLDLSDRIAVVTGAAGGIGRGIVSVLRHAGARVVAADLEAAALEKAFGGSDGTPAAGDVEADDPDRRGAVECVAFDVTDETDVRRGLERIAERVGAPGIVVNGAGLASRVGLPFTRLEAADWRLSWEVNVVGTFNVSAAAVPYLTTRAGAAIVNIASVSGRTGFQTSPPYSASKAAVINFTQVMAKDLAAEDVRVNAVCPGMVFTPFYRMQREAMAEVDPAAASQTDEEFFEAKATRLVPLGRGQTPEDIGHAVAFLASPLASSITGQALNVDGGLVMS